MKNETLIEAQNAQTKISQKLIKQGEISTFTDNMQVDSQATTIQQKTPEIQTKNQDKKENYYFNNSEKLEANLLNSDFILQDALTEEHLDSNEPDDLPLQDEFEQIALEEQDEDKLFEEYAGNTASLYLLRAQRLFECKNSQAHNLAAKTILAVHHNTKANWLLIGIAAYRVQLNTVPLPGGAGKTDDLEVGRKKALERLAQNCASSGVPITSSTLYDYARWVRVLLEEPLEKYAGDKKTIRRERIVLMKKYFAMPPSLARTISTGTEAAVKLELASRLEEAKGAAITNAELKNALRTYFKNNKNENNTVGDSLDKREVAGVFDTNASSNIFKIENENYMALRPDDSLKIEANSTLVEFFASHTNSEAQRTEIEPEKLQDLYVSFLQMMLSTVKNMAVKK